MHPLKYLIESSLQLQSIREEELDLGDQERWVRFHNVDVAFTNAVMKGRQWDVDRVIAQVHTSKSRGFSSRLEFLPSVFPGAK